MNKIKHPESIELANYHDDAGEKHIVTIKYYYEMLEAKNKEGIANFIYERLYSRYIKPFIYCDSVYEQMFKNGFSMMANFCLLIETLVSFKNGWGDSDRKSDQAFKQFFFYDHNFEEFKNLGGDFYKNIRCGILHQGETTGGWKITRNNNSLFDESTKTINANEFSYRINESLKNYKQSLITDEWDSELWDNLRRKMRSIISNC